MKNVLRILVASGVAIALLIAPFVPAVPDYWIVLLNYVGIASLISIGLVVLTGVGGMTSLGQAALAGCGAYTSAVVSLHLGMSPWLALPVCLAVTGVIAFVVGIVTVNLSGHFLPLCTLAWGMAMFYLFGNSSWLGAYEGLSGIPPLQIGSRVLSDPRDYFVLVWIAVVVTVFISNNLLNGRTGRAIRSLRQGTEAAEAFGVPIATTKLQVFVYCALLAGLSGWLYAYFQRAISPGPFGIEAGIEYLLMAVVGGSGRIFGGILGAAGVSILRDRLQNFLPWLTGTTLHFETIIFGAILVLSLQVAPQGIWPIIAGSPAPKRLPVPAGNKRLPSRLKARSRGRLLEVRNVTKTFGGLIAVNDLSFGLRAGEILGLIGPNGAGKTTLFNSITGVVQITKGEIDFDGKAIHRCQPQEIARRGLARTFQHPTVITDMSVLENVALGAHLRGQAGIARSMLQLDGAEEALLFANALEQLQRVGLADLADQSAGALALGQLRLLEIARALCADPVLLLLDEPAAGLRTAEKKALAKLLSEIRADGISVLLVEHDMEFLMGIVDRIVVVDFGTKIAEGLPAEIRQDQKVIDAYLGGVVE